MNNQFNDYDMTNPYEIARFIKEAKKTTPARAYVYGNLKGTIFGNIDAYGSGSLWVLFGDYGDINAFISGHKADIEKYRIECGARNSAVPMLDISNIDARIEPGAIIRDKVSIGKKAVIMMGAVINIGAEIGEGAMVDMNAVIGARGKVGKYAHIGAGAVIAGVLEPPSSDPVIIEDNVLVGANAVVLEGIRVGKGSVVAAGSVVTSDVEPGSVVAGAPARFIKYVDQKTVDKTKIQEDLRK